MRSIIFISDKIKSLELCCSLDDTKGRNFSNYYIFRCGNLEKVWEPFSFLVTWSEKKQKHGKPFQIASFSLPTSKKALSLASKVLRGDNQRRCWCRIVVMFWLMGKAHLCSSGFPWTTGATLECGAVKGFGETDRRELRVRLFKGTPTLHFIRFVLQKKNTKLKENKKI